MKETDLNESGVDHSKAPKRILVTGGCGFIGSNLVRMLLSETDCHVLNVDKLTYAGNPESLRDLESHPRYEFVHADLCDARTIEATIARFVPDAVMHLAAESHVDRSIDSPSDFIQTNVVGTYNLLQASLSHFQSLSADRQDDFRFLHVSTDEVYGTLGFDDAAFCESTAYDPHSPYSASKAGSDHLARAWYSTYRLPVLITNCSNNYGPYQFPEKLIPVVILKCLRDEPIPVYGKGENVRDWLYVGDHCRALLEVVRNGQPGQTYNIGGNNERSNLDVVKMICRLLDEFRPASSGEPYESLIEFVRDRPGHDLRYAINAERIRSEIGWQPSMDFESGFRATVQWYLKNQSWWQAILSGEYRLQRQGCQQQ